MGERERGGKYLASKRCGSYFLLQKAIDLQMIFFLFFDLCFLRGTVRALQGNIPGVDGNAALRLAVPSSGRMVAKFN